VNWGVVRPTPTIVPHSPADAKRSRELTTLRHVYDDRAFFSVQHGDRPDFVLQTSPVSQPFGVEVTEIHRSDSAARVTHMPEYAVELIKGGQIRHKLDALLTIGPVEFTSPDGRKMAGRALALDPMPLDAYRAALANVICTKRSRSAGYRTGLSHTNLVIRDHAEPFVISPPDVANAIIFNDAVWSGIMSARFNEIYLVTRLTPTPSEQPRMVYLPLRQLLLIATAMMLPSALRDIRPGYRLRTHTHRIAALSDYLNRVGMPARLRRIAGDPEVVVQALGVRIDAKGGIHAMDYLDVPALQPEPAPRFRSHAPWRESSFDAVFRRYRSRNFIRFSHAFPARTG
jgi:hypothetical protein